MALPVKHWDVALAALMLAASATAGDSASAWLDAHRNLSGLWLDADRANQGLMIEQIDSPDGAPDGGAPRVVVSWFTWAPASDGRPGARWLFGIGRRDGLRIVVDPMQIAINGNFPRQVVGAPVQRTFEDWGVLVITAGLGNDAPQATLTYEGPAAWGQGERELRQLTVADHGFPYNIAFSPPAPNIFMPSGTYSNSHEVGQGWILNMYGRPEPHGSGPTTTRVESILLWYTFDDLRQPAWMVGLDPDIRDGTEFSMQIASRGGTFEGGVPELRPWGTVKLRGNGPPPHLSASCIVRGVTWAPSQVAYENGDLDVGRIATPHHGENQLAEGLCFSN
jgi:hypothetical protein